MRGQSTPLTGLLQKEMLCHSRSSSSNCSAWMLMSGLRRRPRPTGRLAAARKQLEELKASTDYSWMREQRQLKHALNPCIALTTCFYDFSRGKIGTQDGVRWVEGEGSWKYVRAGSARVPCVKLVAATIDKGKCKCDTAECRDTRFEDAFLQLRVPFKKNGGGRHLNEFTGDDDGQGCRRSFCTHSFED